MRLLEPRNWRLKTCKPPASSLQPPSGAGRTANMRRRDRVIAIAVLGLSVLRLSLMRGDGSIGSPRGSGDQSGVGSWEGTRPSAWRVSHPRESGEPRTPSPLPRGGLPESRYVRGCPACCCDVKVPVESGDLRLETGSSHPRESGEAKRAMHYCLRSGDKTCVNMCKQWMKERKLKFRGR